MNINPNKIIKFILKVIFLLSIPFITLFFSTKYFFNKEIILGMVLTIVIGLIIVIKYKNMYNKISLKDFLIVLYLSLCMYKLMLPYAGNNISLLNEFVNYNIDAHLWKLIQVALSFPAMLTLIYYGYLYLKKIVTKFYQGLSSLEKKYLLIMLIVGFISTTLIYNITDCFYRPSTYNTETVYYDIIYTTDSGTLLKNDAFMDFSMEENDIRQPLFGVFAFPFALLAHLVSQVLFFIPNSYAVCFNTIQILLVAISYLFVSRMLKLEGKQQLFYLLISLSAFSTIIFSFVIEQYIIGLFYLILSFYIANQKLMKVNYFYIGAVGTLITSGIIFPVISKFKNMKNWITNTFKCFCAFLTVTILSGQLYQFFHIKEKLEMLKGFIGEKLCFYDRLLQFFEFVKNIFLSPKSHMVYYVGYPSYQLALTNEISIIGVAILILCFISAIINRKNKMAILSSLWIIFSFILLCVIGWGTQENGLILYSLYFSWAYFILIYLFIDKIIKNKKYKYAVFTIIIICLLLINIPGIIDVIKFGIEYYSIH